MYQEIEIEVVSASSNRVTVIKNIRELTGLGLKEAKDATERPGIQIYQIDQLRFGLYPEPDREIEKLVANIRAAGGVRIQLNGIGKILDELRSLATDALRMGEDELANEILQMVLAEKLRRNVK